MIRRTPLQRKSRLKRGRQLVKSNRKRRAAALLRAYGPEERRAFVRGLPCVACGRVGFSENAHTQTGGMGRKADYRFVVPLCGHLWSIVVNCHGELHRLGIKSFEAKYGIDLEQEAAKCEAAWQAFKTTQTVRNTA